MNTIKHGRRGEIRYSEAFKRDVVRELEEGEMAFDAISLKYGIKGKGTVSRWVRQYGNGTRGKVIRVESPGEINELNLHRSQSLLILGVRQKNQGGSTGFLK